MTTFYAIRRRCDGAYMPEVPAKAGDGHRSATKRQPSLTKPPRLFTTRRGAVQALNWWLKGRVWVNWSEDDNITITSDPSRKAADFEVCAALVATFRMRQP